MFSTILHSPYYVSLNTSRRTDTSRAFQAYEIDAGNTISASASPMILPRQSSNDALPDLNLGLAALSRRNSSRKLQRTSSSESTSRLSDSARIDISPETSLSSFHYGARQVSYPFLLVYNIF